METIIITIKCSFYIPIIISFIVLSNYKIIKRVLFSIGMQIMIRYVACIISIVSIIFAMLMEQFIELLFNMPLTGAVWIDKLYMIGYIISLWISPFYAYAICQKNKNNWDKKQLFNKIIRITAMFIIITTLILLFIHMFEDKLKILENMDIYG